MPSADSQAVDGEGACQGWVGIDCINKDHRLDKGHSGGGRVSQGKFVFLPCQ